MIRVSYKSQEEKEKLIQEYTSKGYILIGVGTHPDGSGDLDFGTEEDLKPQMTIEEYKQNLLMILKNKVRQLLEKTDYVLLKAYEHKILGFSDKVNEIKQQYSTTLQQRQQIRAWNSQKETEIQNVTTYEELDAILVEIEQYEGQ